MPQWGFPVGLTAMRQNDDQVREIFEKMLSCCISKWCFSAFLQISRSYLELPASEAKVQTTQPPIIPKPDKKESNNQAIRGFDGILQRLP
jgi:hypothetical protein